MIGRETEKPVFMSQLRPLPIVQHTRVRSTVAGSMVRWIKGVQNRCEQCVFRKMQCSRKWCQLQCLLDNQEKKPSVGGGENRGSANYYCNSHCPWFYNSPLSPFSSLLHYCLQPLTSVYPSWESNANDSLSCPPDSNNVLLIREPAQ